MLQRRKFIFGLGLAPAIIKTTGLLMPIKVIKPIKFMLWDNHTVYTEISALDKINRRRLQIFLEDLLEFEKDAYDICR